MNRRLTTWTLVAVAALGLTACSAPAEKSPEPATTSAAPAETTPAAEPTTEQTVAEACTAMAGPLQKASATMAELAQAGTDPQSAVDSWTALVDAYQELTDTVTNSEVKAAATTATTDLTAVRDALSKIYLDGDTGAMGDLTTATSDMQKSLTSLTTLCAG